LSGTLIIIRKPKVWRTDGRTWGSLYTPDSRRAGYKEILTMVRIEGCAVGHIFDRRHPKTLLPKFSKSRSSGFRGDADSRDFYY